MKLCDKKISEAKLKKYKLQLMGQLAISSENKENVALSLGKSYLRYGKYDSNEQVQEKIDAITAEQLMQIAREVFDVNKLSVLRYTRS
jgi:predicted Zn-dependent peptidase